MRNILNGVIIVGLAAIVLMVAELGFRLFTPFPTASNETYVADKHTLYRHKPNSSGWEASPVDEFNPAWVHYNNLGFRGEDFPQAKTSGEIRVALLGDSIVEGRQMAEEHTMAAYLRNKLSALSDDPIRVVNAGVSAFTTTTANLMLKRHVVPISPDVVIYVFFANDYADNYVYGNYSQYSGILRGEVPEKLIPEISGPDWRAQPLLWLRRHSAMVHFAMTINDRQATTNSLKAVDKIQGQSDDFRQSARNVNKSTLNGDEASILDFTHRGLEEMNNTCAKLGIPFLVAIMPFPPQVSANEWKTGKQRYGFAPDAVMSETIYQDRLKEFGKDHSIPVIDLLPALKSSSSERLNFLIYDGHLTSSGHEVTAAVMAPEILKLIKLRK